MPTLYAQPYDLEAAGFFFDDGEDFTTKLETCRNRFGQPVEEFEIQFIDGCKIEQLVFEAFDVHQGNVQDYLNALDQHDEYHLIALIAMGECGYDLSFDTDISDVSLYFEDSLKDLAVQFIEEGLYGSVPKALESYIDYDAIARDLGMDYSEIDVGDRTVIFRCP